MAVFYFQSVNHTLIRVEEATLFAKMGQCAKSQKDGKTVAFLMEVESCVHPHIPSCVLIPDVGRNVAHKNKRNVTNMVACECCVNTRQAHSNHDKYTNKIRWNESYSFHKLYLGTWSD